MSQRFKSIYFADHPAASPSQRHLKIAFASSDEQLFHTIRPLSSQELRDLIGFQSYNVLKTEADTRGLPVSTLCLDILRNSVNDRAVGNAYMVSLTRCPTQPEIDPIHATFRGGEAEPLQSWYPLLEGYSPEFVKQVLRSFSPAAKSVLDPFSGTGTTPLTVARLGLRSFYCEINPLLQFLTRVKSTALALNDAQREGAIDSLASLSLDLETKVQGQPRSNDLEEAYHVVFGVSSFFDSGTFDLVLRSRSLVDYIACTDSRAADFLTVAILATLIPSSNLQRAGDLRFKTAAELERKREGFVHGVASRLAKMARDLGSLDAEDGHESPTLVCEDAKSLALLPPLRIDAVVTSPPYLNGTNYFRNTKVELWFLRSLRSSDELAHYRHRSVTAGINDVTGKKQGKASIPEVFEVVCELERSAYDPRIPKMVLNYFKDIETVFCSLRRHLADGATIAVDIGDSAYGGVHVQTDKLLRQLLEAHGFVLDQEVLLRRRRSRGGFELSQVLLILRNLVKKQQWSVRESAPTAFWHGCWLSFKRELPHQRFPMSKRNWGHPLHSLCSYQGKLKPSLASHLVRTFVPESGVMLDPFAGVGTLPFEAALNGVHAYGFDFSPAAIAIAAAKLGKPLREECSQVLEALSRYLQREKITLFDYASARSISFNRPLPDYFEAGTLREILLARRFFLESPPTSPSQRLVFASLLHILHGNRPYALSRRSHPITPFAPSGPFEYRPLMPRLADKVNRGLAPLYPPTFVEGHMFFQDATSWWPYQVDRLDAIITSPPFFDSTRFHLANWMRLWFCGWEAKDFQSKPLAFVDERQKLSFSVYGSVFRQARERLKPGGVVVMHLGQSRKCDMANEIAKVAKTWFRVADVFVESVAHCESHGIRDKGTVEAHQFLVLE